QFRGSRSEGPGAFGLTEMDNLLNYAFLDGLAITTLVLAGLILFVSLDDLYVDARYWAHMIRRTLLMKRRYQPLPVDAIRAKDEQPIAIIVPAWHEDDVIASMVGNLASTLEYANYVVFVGTYQNDPATIAEVERMRRRYRHVHRVEVPND